jgi:hypothetical protein
LFDLVFYLLDNIADGGRYGSSARSAPSAQVWWF